MNAKDTAPMRSCSDPAVAFPVPPRGRKDDIMLLLFFVGHKSRKVKPESVPDTLFQFKNLANHMSKK